MPRSSQGFFKRPSVSSDKVLVPVSGSAGLCSSSLSLRASVFSLAAVLACPVRKLLGLPAPSDCPQVALEGFALWVAALSRRVRFAELVRSEAEDSPAPSSEGHYCYRWNSAAHGLK